MYEPLQDWISARNAATNLLQMLARYRKADTMPIVLPFLQQLLVEYNSLPAEQRNYVKKDGVMTALSALVKVSSVSEQPAADGRRQGRWARNDRRVNGGDDRQTDNPVHRDDYMSFRRC